MLRHRPAYNYSLRFYSTATPRKRQGRWTILSTKRLEVQAAALLEARIGVVTIGSDIYFLGGERWSGTTCRSANKMFRYDTAADAWTELPDMPYERRYFAITAII